VNTAERSPHPTQRPTRAISSPSPPATRVRVVSTRLDPAPSDPPCSTPTGGLRSSGPPRAPPPTPQTCAADIGARLQRVWTSCRRQNGALRAPFVAASPPDGTHARRRNGHHVGARRRNGALRAPFARRRSARLASPPGGAHAASERGSYSSPPCAAAGGAAASPPRRARSAHSDEREPGAFSGARTRIHVLSAQGSAASECQFQSFTIR